MIRVHLDGVTHEVPLAGQKSFHEVLRHIKSTLLKDVTLISGIRVDGVDVGASEEKVLSDVLISESNDIDIYTAHPKEIAEETLQLLMRFTQHIEKQALVTADQLGHPKFREEFGKLLEGLNTFADALTNARQTLGIAHHPELDLNEADLISILKDIHSYQVKGEHGYLVQMLRGALIENMIEWRDRTLPAVIQAHSS